MEIISKILMGISYLVVQFIGFVLLTYLLFFAVVCIFTNRQPNKT